MKTLSTLFILNFTCAVFTGTPRSASKFETSATTLSGYAIFLYTGPVGGDVNNPDNYSNTSFDEGAEYLCAGGPIRCAATFQVDASNQRLGFPLPPTYGREAN